MRCGVSWCSASLSDCATRGPSSANTESQPRCKIVWGVLPSRPRRQPFAGGGVSSRLTLFGHRQSPPASLSSPLPMHCQRWCNGAAAPGFFMRTLALIDELEAALASGSIPRRINILSRVADLFINGAELYSEQQVGVFDDVMARLVN